jgi:hypothetical protein
MTAFSYGILLGPAHITRHMRNQVSAHQLSLAFHKQISMTNLQATDTDVINAFARLDIAGI